VQVLFNVLFPDWLQTALLTLLLLFVINKTVRKGVRQWRQESKASRQRQLEAEEVTAPAPAQCPAFTEVPCKAPAKAVYE
jgi:hypothetical protein